MEKRCIRKGAGCVELSDHEQGLGKHGLRASLYKKQSAGLKSERGSVSASVKVQGPPQECVEGFHGAPLHHHSARHTPSTQTPSSGARGKATPQPRRRGGASFCYLAPLFSQGAQREAVKACGPALRERVSRAGQRCCCCKAAFGTSRCPSVLVPVAIHRCAQKSKYRCTVSCTSSTSCI